jgi:class 3 adenylate cyclase
VSVSSPSPHAALETPRVEVTPERQTTKGLDGERKTVTALFADIKGSTELMEDPRPGGGTRDHRPGIEADD